jgi:hypothetical protein
MKTLISPDQEGQRALPMPCVPEMMNGRLSRARLDISGSPSVNGSTAGPLLHCRVAPAGRRLSSSLRMAAGSRATAVKAQEYPSNNVRMDHSSLQRIVTQQSGAREGVPCTGERPDAHRHTPTSYATRMPNHWGPNQCRARHAGQALRSVQVTAAQRVPYPSGH